MTVAEMEKEYGVRLTPADTFVTSTGDDDLGYTTEYRLNEVVPDDKVKVVKRPEGYLQETYDDNDVIGYVISETHCGHGRGCFWTEDEVCQWDATLADWEKLKKS